ncbi:MAG: permease [Candidatus Nanoarchaeia archaeon]
MVDVKKHLKNYAWVILFLIFSISSYFIGFKPGLVIYSNFNEFFIEMVSFIPFLFVIIGLFDIWVPKERIEKHIGKESGVKGIFLVILLAMLQAGPLYGAFPVAYILHKKGASVKNIFIYLGAFSSVKLPMLGIELGYLGIKFTILRTLISLPLFIMIGFIMEKLVGSNFTVREVKA